MIHPRINDAVKNILLSYLFFKKKPITPNSKIDPNIVEEILIAFCKFLLNLLISSFKTASYGFRIIKFLIDHTAHSIKFSTFF